MSEAHSAIIIVGALVLGRANARLHQQHWAPDGARFHDDFGRRADVPLMDGEDREPTVESLAGALAAGTEDLSEGLSAFREQRTPNFRKG